MIGTEFIKGQGLGNQLFCYVTARAVAEENGCEFGTANQEQFANNIHSNRGMYFMDVDLGHPISDSEKKNFTVYQDVETRLFIGNSQHDLIHGCSIGGADSNIHHVPDQTLIYGNMQDESYFANYRSKLKDWLHVKPEYETYEYTRDNLCVMNMRGGEYTGSPELFIDKKYWVNGMKNMRAIRPDMEFIIITDDVEAANKVLPEIPAYHFDMGKDFVILKNAKYLLLSNSSFACLAAFMNEQVEYIIAPKFWARYNVSDGYWASEQNIYSIFHYQDRRGRLFSSQECRTELEQYKATSAKYRSRNQKPAGIRYMAQLFHSKWIKNYYFMKRIVRSVCRRIKRIV